MKLSVLVWDLKLSCQTLYRLKYKLRVVVEDGWKCSVLRMVVVDVEVDVDV